MEIDEAKLKKVLRSPDADLGKKPKLALAVAGELALFRKQFDADLAERTKASRDAIKAEQAVHADTVKKIDAKLNAARIALNAAIDGGLAEAHTKDWRLVVVHQKRPVLEKFDDLPDEYLLPTEQWIDWKKVDEAVKAGTAVPGVSVADVTNARVIPNEAADL